VGRRERAVANMLGFAREAAARRFQAGAGAAGGLGWRLAAGVGTDARRAALWGAVRGGGLELPMAGVETAGFREAAG